VIHRGVGFDLDQSGGAAQRCAHRTSVANHLISINKTVAVRQRGACNRARADARQVKRRLEAGVLRRAALIW
jgi:hypothetical protein